MICASNKLLILSRRKVIFLLGMSLVGLLRAWPARLSADDWPQFRGPNCSGISQSSKSLPTQFSFEENVAWSAELGDGISSPVVANGRVFSTAMVSSDQLAVICHDVDHGTELWKYEVQIDDPPPLTQPNSYASSTPATDGKHLYVYVITRGLIALDILNGEQIWQLPVEQPCFIFNWGAAASPIVFEGMVYFNQDDDLNSFLLCVDAKTGKLRWRTDRPEILAGYAVPVICEFEGRKDLVVAGSGKLKGYDPRTGQELWTCNSLLRNSLTTPVVQHGMIYLSQTILGGESDNVYSKPLLQWKDTDQDGRLTKQEIPESFWERFDRGDANGDGFLIGGEIDEAFQSPGNMVGGGTIVQAIQGGGTGDVTKTHMVWKLDKTRAASDYSSPLAIDDRLFLIKRGGITSVLDKATGETIRKPRRIGNIGYYYASPVVGDGKIYVVGENGFVIVLANGPQLNFLAKNDMGDTCIATPAIADGRLYIRTRSKLFCLTESVE